MDFRIETINGLDAIIITEDRDGIEYNRLIPLDAIASWSELLGYEDPAEALDAIIHVQDNGEPDPDPVTGENAWTAPFAALLEREQRALTVLEEASTQGTRADPRSPRLRASLATLPESSAVDAARQRARAALGVPDPSSAGTARAFNFQALTATLTDPLDTLRDRLRGDMSEEIQNKRARFVRMLSATTEEVS